VDLIETSFKPLIVGMAAQPARTRLANAQCGMPWQLLKGWAQKRPFFNGEFISRLALI
jgi:hypothetical protein